MTLNTSPYSKELGKNKVENCFEELVASLRADQLMMETNTATKEKKAFYETMMKGSITDWSSEARKMSTKHFITLLLNDYFLALNEYNKDSIKIALDLSDAKVLVWAEIKNNDESAEDALLLSEAKVNAKYAQYGFHITSTIVEKSDCLSVPNHYMIVND